MAAKKTSSKTKASAARSKAEILSPAEATRTFRRSGTLSIWVGRFETEEALEAYIDGGDFERDVGYTITRGMEPFHAFVDSPDKLLKAYGFDAKLQRHFGKALAGLGLEANAALLEPDFCFEPHRVRGKARARLRFLGVFRKT